jgi:hypothetical protein
MRKFTILVTIAVVFALGVTGCGFVADGPFGWGYTATKTAVSIGTAKAAGKKGEACVTAFFGFVALGDASIGAAMKNGEIKQIFSIDRDNLSVFGIYTKQCTIVTGD